MELELKSARRIIFDSDLLKMDLTYRALQAMT